MELNLSYKPLQAADIEALQHLSLKIWKQAFTAFLPPASFSVLYQGMYNTGRLMLQIEDPAYHFYFIRHGEAVVGYLAHHEESDHLKLDKLYIDRETRVKGIGSAALLFTYEEAIRLNYSQVHLNVNRGNTRAIEFYTSRGFEIIESVDIPAPGGQVYNDFIMQKIL